MRTTITLWLLFIWTATHAQEDATSVIQSILDVDRSLTEEIRKDISQATERELQLRNEFAKNLNNSVQRLKDALGQRLDKLKQIEQAYQAENYGQQQKAYNEWQNLLDGINKTKVALQNEKEKEMIQQQEDIRRLLDQLSMAYQKKKEERAAEKQREDEQIRQAWQLAKVKLNELQAKLNESTTAKKERRQEMLQSMKSTLDEIRGIISQHQAARKQQQQQRRDELESKMNQVKSDIAARKDDLAAREEELRNKYAQYQQKQTELKNIVQKALVDSVKASVIMEIGDKLQNSIDREALEQVLPKNSTLWQEAVAAPKSTVLDEITGVSAWQTVTWILLALCILLALALVAMIIYQVMQRNHSYQRLDGRDDERVPIARPAPQPRYIEEKNLSVVPVSSAPTVPYAETQQF